MARFLGCLPLVLALLAPPTSAQDSPSLEQIRERYNELEALRASFTQVIHSDFAKDSTTIEGTVVLSGNRYRVETPSQTVVTNGTTTWIYTPADSQVVVNDADSDPSAVTPQAFLTATSEKYEVDSTQQTTRDGTPHVQLFLSSQEPSARFKEAVLWVRRRDQLVTRIRATDQDGSTLDLRLQNIEINPPLGNDPFRFSPPTHAEVIDLRSQQ